MTRGPDATGPLVHDAAVRPEWVDYNGHLSEAYYVLVFGHATDRLLDRIGLDAAGRQATGSSVYTLEAHVRYLREVPHGAQLRVTTRVLDVDDRLLHVFHVMDRTDGDEVVRVATEELLCSNVDTTVGRAAPFADHVLRACRDLVAAHRQEPRPAEAGRAIRPPTERSDD